MRLEVESSLPEDKLIISTAGDGGVLDSIGIVGAWDLSKGVETYLGGVDKLDLWSNLNDRLLQTCNEGLLDPASSSSNLSFFFFFPEVDLDRLLVGDLLFFFGSEKSRIGEARAAVDILLDLLEVVLEVYLLGDQSHLEKSRLIVLESENKINFIA